MAESALKDVKCEIPPTGGVIPVQRGTPSLYTPELSLLLLLSLSLSFFYGT